MEARNELADIRHRRATTTIGTMTMRVPHFHVVPQTKTPSPASPSIFYAMNAPAMISHWQRPLANSGKALAITVIRLRIYREIARHWPVLKAECNRKIAELGPPNFHSATPAYPHQSSLDAPSKVTDVISLPGTQTRR